MRALLLAFAFVSLVATSARSQEDTTPPVLLDFSIAPTVFDTGPETVMVEYCVTARDDLAGLWYHQIVVPGLIGQDLTGFPTADLEQSACKQKEVPRFSSYRQSEIVIRLADQVGNVREYIGGHVDPALDLCQFGPCYLLNRAESEVADGDNDGIADDADNCPSDPNPTQEDTDLDLLGDACDPFPTDRDNEQAQCEADLLVCQGTVATCPDNLAICEADLATCSDALPQCEASLGSCQSMFAACDIERTQCRSDLSQSNAALSSCNDQLADVNAQLAAAQAQIALLQADLATCEANQGPQDSDNDGVADNADQCPDTPAGSPVDAYGCSAPQFCAQFDVSQPSGSAACYRADWRNNELPRFAFDCRVEAGICVARKRACGFGLELALILPPIFWARRLRSAKEHGRR